MARPKTCWLFKEVGCDGHYCYLLRPTVKCPVYGQDVDRRMCRGRAIRENMRGYYPKCKHCPRGKEV